MSRSTETVSFARRLGVALGTMACALPSVVHAQAAPSWSAVEQAFGRTGVPQPGDVMRFNFPRRDLRVMVGDVQVRPSLALGTWLAFKRMPDGQAMVMGDLVLTDNEINPVISALQQGGVEQTAVHNHISGGTPNTMYVHVRAHGREVDIARTIRRALETTKTPLDTAAAGPAPTFDLDTAAVAKALGYSGRVNGGVYQVNVARTERITEDGHEIPSSMGLWTAINFQPTGGGKAAITGDFVMIGTEVNPVIRALRDNGIGITALHSHLIGETPRLYFMHFWANDDAIKLARGLNAALAKTNSAKPR
ncbi:MAG TPA: DUF1259 domain-containing protein [Gemmatimonadaceae bacterium]